MENYQMPYFGEINISALEEYYDAEIELNGSPVSIDINFKNSSIDQALALTIAEFLENISGFNKQNKTVIADDFNSEDGEVRNYVTFHIEELGSDFLEQLAISHGSSDKEQQLLAKLKLVRIGLYPDGKYDECFAVFDYTIDRELTDELIVVKTDKDGNLDHIAWES